MQDLGRASPAAWRHAGSGLPSRAPPQPPEYSVGPPIGGPRRQSWTPGVGEARLPTLGYSRVSTATLGADVDSLWSLHGAPQGLRGRSPRPGFSPVRANGLLTRSTPPPPPAPPPAHMQLFVLGYGEEQGKDGVAALDLPAPDISLRPRVSSTGAAATAAAAAARARARAAALRRETRPGVVRNVLQTWHSEDADSDGSDASTTGTGGGSREGEVPKEEHPDAFANAIRLPIRIGQVFSVLPVDAMTGSWSRARAAYAAGVTTGLGLLAILSAVQECLRPKPPSLVDVMVVVFYLMSFVTSLLFVRLGRGWWAALLRSFRAQERRQGPCPGLHRKLTAIAAVLLGVSFVEHSLSEMNSVVTLRRLNPNASTLAECLQIYFTANYPMVFMAIGYWPVLSPIFFCLNFIATFLWNFNDLFIMLLGVAVSTRFRCLRDSIARALGSDVQAPRPPRVPPPVLGTAYWRSARRAFNALSKLARLVDGALNIQLMVSFLNNLYFVCMQLLRGFDDPNTKWYELSYILFSFSFLVARTTAVSLLAASVHEDSRSVQDVLYSVSSEDYNEEVHRLLVQVTSEDVALSGCHMFKVTRGLLLTVAGTILTYEVVLVQLH